MSVATLICSINSHLLYQLSSALSTLICSINSHLLSQLSSALLTSLVHSKLHIPDAQLVEVVDYTWLLVEPRMC